MAYKKLKQELNIAAKAYYLLGELVMTDDEYDFKYKQLLEIEKNQGFTDKDSPSVRVGYTGLNNEKPHTRGKILSLENTHTKEELASFFKGNTSDLVVMPKLDGLSMVLYYSGGLLDVALLRGDGVVGADVTDLAVSISGVPISVESTHDFKVVGEVVALHNNWEKDYKNHRNYVVGAMNMVDVEAFKNKGLSFIAFDTDIPDCNYFIDRLEKLEDTRGITCVSFERADGGTDQDTLRKDFRSLFKHCDGLVYAQNDLNVLLGSTDHHPYNKVAFKFPTEKIVTKLLGITWEMGRTKTLTPVATVEPVILDGATVTRASLCNLQNIEKRNIAINDYVIIHKAGEIIPQILGTSKPADDRITIEITKCPVCLHDVSVSTTGIVSCVNTACGGSGGKTLTHFCKAVGIKGIGSVIAEQLSEDFSIVEVLNMDDSDLCRHSSIAEANSSKVSASIKESFTSPRWKAWVGLGIPNCGKSLCEKLPVGTLFDLTYENLIAMPKVADITATKVLNWVDSNVDLIQDIETLYNIVEHTITDTKDFKKIYVTGTLSKSRANMKPILLEHGMLITTSLSRNTDLFLAGKGAKQHKIDKARELGIKIIYEKDLT